MDCYIAMYGDIRNVFENCIRFACLVIYEVSATIHIKPTPLCIYYVTCWVFILDSCYTTLFTDTIEKH